MLAVIRLRGTINANREVIDTLKLLRLHRKMHCIVLPENDNYKGMLQKVKDYITWGSISDTLLVKLVSKRGRKTGNKRVNPNEGNNIVSAIKLNEKIPAPIKPVFRLNPPSKGFKKSIKQHFPKGELGNRGEKINELLERMI